MLAWGSGNYVEVPDGATVADLEPELSLFETFALRQGRVECLSDHFARLALACPRLGLNPARLYLGAGPTRDRWAPILQKLLAAAQLTDAIVRLIVKMRSDVLAHEWLTVRPLPPTPLGIDLFSIETWRDPPEWYPRPKSGPWANSARGLKELKKVADRPDAEAVQFALNHRLSEGTRSSLAWWADGAWHFPDPLTCYCIPGTAAAQFRSVVQQAGREVREVAVPFPANALSMVVLRSTFAGGAVLARNYFSRRGEVAWQAAAEQPEATARLAELAAWRAQRSVSLL